VGRAGAAAGEWEPVIRGLGVQGSELIANLADLDQKLAAELEEARRAAEARIKDAEKESRRVLAMAAEQISRLEEESQARVAAESSKITEEARFRAEEEKERLRAQAQPQLDQAVAFVLSKVRP
jgi:vacuolar-type H+-ATPase subunit H